MLNFKKNTSIVGLDIQTGSAAATEVVVNGSAKAVKTGVVPLPLGATRDGEILDPSGLAESLKELFSEHKLSRQVRIGLANQRVVVRVLRLPLIDKREDLEAAIRFQAKDQMPMALDQAVMDWQVTSRGVGDGGKQMDVAVVAARREMVDSVLSSVKLAGLRPVGIDLSAFGMLRALRHEIPVPGPYGGPAAPADPLGPPAAEGLTQPDGFVGEEGFVEPEGLPMPEALSDLAGEEALLDLDQQGAPYLYCDFGDMVNFAVARGGNCMFSRVSPFGVEGMAQRVAERRGLALDHARQVLFDVGLERELSEIEGDPEVLGEARNALLDGASKLSDELRLSLEFFSAQEGAIPIAGVIASGAGTMIDGLSPRLEGELGYPFRVARPVALSHLGDALAARLTLSYGLGLGE